MKKNALTSKILALAYLALIMILFGRALLGEKVFCYGIDDGTLLIYPLRQLFREGTIFWTNKIFGGFPIYAEPHFTLFYPLTWILFKLFPVEIAVSYLLVLELIIAGLFTYLFARQLGLSEVPAFVSGVSFSLLGFLPSYLDSATVLHSLVWLPAVFFSLELLLKKRRLLLAVLLAFSIAIQISAGYPQIVLITLIGASIYVIARLLIDEKDENIKNIKICKEKLFLFSCFFLSVVLALGLMAPQLISNYELTKLSQRSSGLDFVKATESSWSPANILTFFFPFLFKGLPPQVGSPGLNYLGILPFFFVIFSFLKTKDHRVRTMLLLAIASVFLALGYFNPFYRIISVLPGFKLLRTPSRYFVLAQFALSVLAGFGMNRILERRGKREIERVLRISRYLVIFLLLVIVTSSFFLKFARPIIMNYGKSYVRAKFFGQPDHPYPLEHYYQRLENYYNRLKVALSLFNPNFFLPVVLILTSFLLLQQKVQNKIEKPIFEKAVVGLLLLEVLLFFYQGKLIPIVKRGDFIRKPQAYKVLKDDQSLFRSYSYPHWEYRIGKVEEARQKGNYYLPLAFAKETLQPNLNIFLTDKESISSYLGLYLGRMHSIIKLWEVEGNLSEKARLELLTKRYLNLLGWLNVKYILTRSNLSSKNLEQVYSSNEVKVYRNKLWMSRFFLVPNYQVANPNKIFKKITSSAFQPSKVVFLEENPKLKNYQPFNKAKLEIIKYSDTEIKLKAHLDGSGFLFISQNFYPGWQAKVNGKDTPIYRANYAFQAIFLNKGENFVKMTFEPLSFKSSFAVSGLSLFITMGILIWEIISKSHQNEQLKKSINFSKSFFQIPFRLKA